MRRFVPTCWRLLFGAIVNCGGMFRNAAVLSGLVVAGHACGILCSDCKGFEPAATPLELQSSRSIISITFHQG